jgi:hypothetical protein
MTISVAPRISYFSWKRGILSFNKIVISTGAQRSGEICGFSSGSHPVSLASAIHLFRSSAPYGIRCTL